MLCVHGGASGRAGRKDVTAGRLGEAWWPEDGPDLGEFTWELGLVLPIQKPHFVRPRSQNCWLPLTSKKLEHKSSYWFIY